MSPILWHYFSHPLPYTRTLALQERIHQLQLLQRHTSTHKDILLLLQHLPVYTAGRRQTEDSVERERARLTALGSDFVATSRGGQLTYHGPGQLVGYPLLDLSRPEYAMSTRDYVCGLQKMLEAHLKEVHGLDHAPSEHTGIFLDPVTKVASIGVQVRHYLTSHGFAMNVTREPLKWFNQVVACGLDDVKAGCIEAAAGKPVKVESEIPRIVEQFGQRFGREMVPIDTEAEGEVGQAISELEDAARRAGNWRRAPAEMN
jgi:lipoyl(octanoyl) transferase 2